VTLEFDLSADERIELSVHSPNLLLLLEREPPVEETRKRAREEVANLLREAQRLRTALRGNGKLSVDLSHAEVKQLHDELGDVPARLVKPKLMSFYRRLGNLVGIDWLEEDTEKKRRRR
jgi:hypothetical protein